jgi:hypothetical protein
MRKRRKAQAYLCTGNWGGIEITFEGITNSSFLYARSNYSGIPSKWVKRPIEEYVENEETGEFISTFTLYGDTYNLNDFLKVRV